MKTHRKKKLKLLFQKIKIPSFFNMRFLKRGFRFWWLRIISTGVPVSFSKNSLASIKKSGATAWESEIFFRFLLQQVYDVRRKLHCKQYFCKSSAFFLISATSHRVFFHFRLTIVSKLLKNLHVSELFLIFAAK